MSVPLAEYLSSGLGTDAVITTASGPVKISGKFSSKYKVAKVLNLEVECSRAQIKCLSETLTNIKHGDAVQISGEGKFYIAEIQPMGNNVTILVLTND